MYIYKFKIYFILCYVKKIMFILWMKHFNAITQILREYFYYICFIYISDI